MMQPSDEELKELIQRALQEDIGGGDVTTNAIIPSEMQVRGEFIAKADGVIAGLRAAEQAFSLLDERVEFVPKTEEGGKVAAGDIIATVSGPGRAILSAERTALNILQRMSGIATLTRRFADAVAGTRAFILDTRKTAPGLRILDKWAVRLGGGQNHRFGLFDMVLIKENHISAAGGITAAVNQVKSQIGSNMAIEVEVQNFEELHEALGLEIQRILLDNMTVAEIAEAVKIAAGKIPLEASGNISLENVAKVARTGVDYISVGQLTHSVTALDISLIVK